MHASPPATPDAILPDADPRAEQAYAFALAHADVRQGAFTPASADASFRRYFRLRDGVRSWIVMDAPPDKEDVRPFVHIAGLFTAAGLRAPRVLAQDAGNGFLLLDDLGTQTYLDVFQTGDAAGGTDVDTMMQAALDALLRWQRASQTGTLPPYDEPLLRRELALFADWFVSRHLGTELSAAQRDRLARIEDRLVESALAQPRVWVHRDYMPRNLMAGADVPGILDFQDAVEGPISYDLVSLLRDAFWSWPDGRVETWMRHYWQTARAQGLPVGDDYAEFRRAADWMGVQRHLKVLGIFARIRYRDGKPKYLQDAPRFIAYLREVAGRYAELDELLVLFDELGLHAV